MFKSILRGERVPGIKPSLKKLPKLPRVIP